MEVEVVPILRVADAAAALRSCRSRVADAVLAEFGRPDGEPPYGCEFEIRDPDGNRLRIRRLAS